MPKKMLPLLLVALLGIGAALILALAASQSQAPDTEQSAERSAPERERERAPRSNEQAAASAAPRLDPAEQAAVRYALAARNWTPDTYQDSWDRQFALAGDPLRDELQAARPTEAEVDALRSESASMSARLVRLRRDTRLAEPEARVLVVLDERTVATGQALKGHTVNEVTLRRENDGWEVTGFTIAPGVDPSLEGAGAASG